MSLHETVQQHPAFKWIGIALTVLPLFSVPVATLWFLWDLQARDELWLQEDVRWNEGQLEKMQQILDRQLEIQAELATHSLRLSELVETLERHSDERRERVIQLQSGQMLIQDAVGRMGAEVSRSLGWHEGMHESER